MKNNREIIKRILGKVEELQDSLEELVEYYDGEPVPEGIMAVQHLSEFENLILSLNDSGKDI